MFRLPPWPFAEPMLRFPIQGRTVAGETFVSHDELRAGYAAVPTETVIIELLQ
jgi:hypothetical protein